MVSTARLGICVAAAAALAGLVLPAGSARAQSNCHWYATTALKQQQDNERLRCGFTGPSWSSDMRGHLNWCSVVSPELWRAEAQKRDRDLGACAASKR